MRCSAVCRGLCTAGRALWQSTTSS
jgi:hypothetical protein